jgi:hypothetical protein
MLTDLMGDVIPKDQYFDTRRDAIAAAVEFVESPDKKKPKGFHKEPAPR